MTKYPTHNNTINNMDDKRLPKISSNSPKKH
jgi:hypothetical protein